MQALMSALPGGGIVAAGAPSGGDAGEGDWEDRDDDGADDDDEGDDPWNPDHEDDEADSENGDEAINVRVPDGSIVIAYTHSSDLVDVLKTVLKNITGIPTRHQRLTYNNRELEDGDEFHIPEGHIVVLSMRIRGGVAKVKTTKFEKQLVLKSRATATNAALQPFTLNPALLQQASMTYTEMMAVENIGYIQGLIAQMSIAELERATEGLGELKMNEANLKKIAPLFTPNLDALQQTHTFLTGAIKTLESAFEFAFMHSYYDEEGCAYAYQNFLNNVHNALTEKRLEAAILQRHGIMVP